MRSRWLECWLSLVCTFALPALADAYTFVDVANSSGPYSQFAPPSINAEGDLAFRADIDGGGRAILTGSGSGTSIVADTTGAYSEFLTQVAINDGGTVVFRANRDTGGVGIYTGPDPATDRIADDGATFLDFNVDLFAINASGTVVFQAVLEDGTHGLFIGVSPVVDDKGPFELFSIPDINDAGTVAFRATLDGAGGTVIKAAAATVADAFGPYGGFGEFVSINEAGAVAFTAFLDGGGSGVFVGDDPATDTIADTSGPYASLQQPSIDDTGGVTFLAQLDAGGAGIFTGPDAVADRVIASGDALFDSTVSNVGFFSKGSNAAGDVAFTYFLANGRNGVAIATVPEAGGVAGSVAAVALLLGFCARRSE